MSLFVYGSLPQVAQCCFLFDYGWLKVCILLPSVNLTFVMIQVHALSGIYKWKTTTTIIQCLSDLLETML